ncbi:hypothetical protein Cgig2_007058 [Carnegiea gigantea]|uniref:Uncharacterized protein n=1 Tax=Carnegiea gigantea TaxID=171969 RepID=A0A9Q1K8W1_9CARY|nr:hypothetical protein Cgig2_007058 [Carnegiea gigantea]
MSASFQGFPQLGPPPPGMVVYPTTMTTTTTSTNEDNPSQASGSFGMVFVVLAIILVVSAVACVLGRFCTKKSNKSHQPKAHKQQSHGASHHHKQGHNHTNHYKPNHGHNPHQKNDNHHGPKHGKGRPKDPDLEFGYRSKEGDIMLGFEPKVKFPTAKVANNGDFRANSFSKPGMEYGANQQYLKIISKDKRQ